MFVKRKAVKALDKRIETLTNDIHYCKESELDGKVKELSILMDARELCKKPKLTKDEKVEILKILGALTLLGVAIVYDAKGHILPRSLDNWIPKPKL